MTGDEHADPESTGQDPTHPASRRWIVVTVVAAVAVLAAVGVLVYLLTSGDDEDLADPDQPTITGSAPPTSPLPTAPSEEPSTPLSTPTTQPPPANENVAAARTVAERAAAAIQSRDVGAMEQLACDPNTVGTVEDFPPEASARLVGNPEITGDKATAQVELTIEGSQPTVVPLPLENHDGTWCVP